MTQFWPLQYKGGCPGAVPGPILRDSWCMLFGLSFLFLHHVPWNTEATILKHEMDLMWMRDLLKEQKDGRSLGPWHDTSHSYTSGSHSFLFTTVNWGFLSPTANPQSLFVHLELGILHKAGSCRRVSSHIWPTLKYSIFILSVTKIPFLLSIPLGSKHTSSCTGVDSKGTS